MESDAFGVGIGVVLMQDHHPIAYISQALKGGARQLFTYEKEMLASLLQLRSGNNTYLEEIYHKG